MKPTNDFLFTGRKPPKLVILSSMDGKMIAFLSNFSGFERRYVVSTPARSGFMPPATETTTVFEQEDADHYKHLADVPTGFRAKTSIFVPELNRLYVAVSGKGKANRQARKSRSSRPHHESPPMHAFVAISSIPSPRSVFVDSSCDQFFCKAWSPVRSRSRPPNFPFRIGAD